jgi:hypothetical protein
MEHKLEHKPVAKQIKKCPFCGKDDTPQLYLSSEINSDAPAREPDADDWFAVCCDFNVGGCGGTGGYRPTKAEAVKAWNSRKR